MKLSIKAMQHEKKLFLNFNAKLSVQMSVLSYSRFPVRFYTGSPNNNNNNSTDDVQRTRRIVVADRTEMNIFRVKLFFFFIRFILGRLTFKN